MGADSFSIGWNILAFRHFERMETSWNNFSDRITGCSGYTSGSSLPVQTKDPALLIRQPVDVSYTGGRAFYTGADE